MNKLLQTLLLFLPSVYSAQDFVINELNCDNPGGPDTQEFIELYGTPMFSLDSLVMVFYDGQSSTCYASFDLDGYSLDENGFFVAGNANTPNVDLIFGNGVMQNGQDAVAIYRADASDFPNGSATSQLDLVEAIVYGTGDAQANNLITGLGLDLLMPGYSQLDETLQQGGSPDISISRIPDGGEAFAYLPFIVQEITPGSWNVPACFAGNISFSDSSVIATFCDNIVDTSLQFSMDETSYGDSLKYVITDESNVILQILEEGNIVLNNMAAGVYNITGIAFNGTLENGTFEVGLTLGDIVSNDCFSLSDDALELVIENCSGCVGGQISDANNATLYAGCAVSESVIVLNNTSTSLDASYIYVVANELDEIVLTSMGEIEVSMLPVGVYQVYGISYSGTIDTGSIQAGMPVSGVSASVCLAYSENTYAITLYDCVEVEPCSELFFSEYIEGNNGTKALEIFNPTSQSIALSEYALLQYANGSATATDTLFLSGTLSPYSVFIVANPSGGGGPGGAADAEVLALADVIDVIANFSGNDAIELRHNENLIDVIGVIGENPGNQTGWVVGNGSTRNSILVRHSDVHSPAGQWEISETQWNVFAADDYSHLGYHLFNPCDETIVAGIITQDVSVDENAGSISFQVMYENVTSPIDVEVIVSGSAIEAEDYVLSSSQLTFIEGLGVVTYNFNIVDDQVLENLETISFALQSSIEIYWIDSTITISIIPNDLNCDGAQIQLTAGNGPVLQCSDLPNGTLAITNNTSMPSAQYVYVVTNANDSILFVESSSNVNMDVLGSGNFRIYGLSYTGSILNGSIDENMLITDAISDSCASISSNFITVVRSACVISGCDGAGVTLSDGASTITVCKDDVSDMWEFNTSSESVDASYMFVITDATDLILFSFANSYDLNDLMEGVYHVYGISYLGSLNTQSLQAGQPVTSILSTECAELSNDFISVYIADCSAVPPCTFLFLSEIIEDSQSNKAIELYNPTNQSIDLSLYTLRQYQDGSTTPTTILDLSGTVAPNDVYVVLSSGNGQTQADPILLNNADILDAVASFTGNDVIELLYMDNVIDRLGLIGENPGNFGWQAGDFSTANQVLVRRPEVNAGNPNWNIVSGQWMGFDQLDFSHIGMHSALSCTTPVLPTIGFNDAVINVEENAGTITVNVSASGISGEVNLVMSVAGTAANSVDFIAEFPVVLTFSSAIVAQSFDISLIDDLVAEGVETIELSLTSSDFFNWSNQQLIINISDPVGIEEFNAVKVNIFPNPASDLLRVISDEVISDYCVFRADGQLVYSGNANGTKGVEINTTSLCQGLYYVTVKTSRSVSRKAFSIVK